MLKLISYRSGKKGGVLCRPSIHRAATNHIKPKYVRKSESHIICSIYFYFTVRQDKKWKTG